MHATRICTLSDSLEFGFITVITATDCKSTVPVQPQCLGTAVHTRGNVSRVCTHIERHALTQASSTPAQPCGHQEEVRAPTDTPASDWWCDILGVECRSQGSEGLLHPSALDVGLPAQHVEGWAASHKENLLSEFRYRLRPR